MWRCKVLSIDKTKSCLSCKYYEVCQYYMDWIVSLWKDIADLDWKKLIDEIIQKRKR